MKYHRGLIVALLVVFALPFVSLAGFDPNGIVSEFDSSTGRYNKIKFENYESFIEQDGNSYKVVGPTVGAHLVSVLNYVVRST